MSAARKARPDHEDRLLDLATAAQRLSVADKTLRRMIDRRQIRAVKVGHGRGVWRIAESEIERVIASGTIPV